MYDRKTWFIVIACSILLAANIHYSTKARQEAAANAPKPPEAPAAPASPGAPGTPVEGGALRSEAPAAPADEKIITLETSEMVFTLSTLGGGIKQAEVKNQFEVGSNDKRVRMNRFGAGPIGAIVGGGQSLENVSYSYLEAKSVPGKKAVFVGTHPSGLIARKTFSIIEDGKTGSPYLLDFSLELENAAAGPISLDAYSLYLGEASPLYQKEWAQQTTFLYRDSGSMHFNDVGEFKGGFFSSDKSIITKDSEKLEFGGVANQFFATVVRPKEPQAGKLWAKPGDVSITPGQATVKSVNAGFGLPALTLATKEPKAFTYQIFMGPCDNTLLSGMGNHWSEVMNYGYFSLAASPLNKLLNWLHKAFSGLGNQWAWGLAIIFLTIIVRTAIWPLYAKSTRSMKRMSKLQPEMAKLKEKYGDDPNRMNQEMMKLYKTYGVNPIGGCLPMLIQLPIFFGFYRMLQYAVELRHQEFLWVNDLSQPDTRWVIGGIPINILPIIMAITSFIQMAMTPKTGDKTQQRIMMFMPFMFFFFCYSFASALALYWTTTNIFSIVQTWLTNKMPEPELKERKIVPGKKTFLERMAEKQQEMERMKRMQADGKGPVIDVSESKKKRPPRTGG
jgi:YidC/Oxa1 family membrane protein insertase